MISNPPKWEPNDDDLFKRIMENRYILKHRKVIPCHSFKEMQKFERHEYGFRNKRVRKTFVDKYLISTVFLTLDHSLDPQCLRPVVFETLIFPTEEIDYMSRGFTWRNALLMHWTAVNYLKALIKEGRIEDIKNA